MEDIKITYKIKVGDDEQIFRNLEDIRDQMIIKKSLLEFEKKIKEANAWQILKKQLNDEQLAQVELIIKEVK